MIGLFWVKTAMPVISPERVGCMLLNSSVNIAGSFDDILLLQEMGKQRLIDEVFWPYGHQRRCTAFDSLCADT